MSHCVIVMAKLRQAITVKDVHENLEQNAHSKIMTSHTVNDPANPKVSERFFWFSIYNDATEKYQKKSDLKKKTVPSNIIK